MLSILTSLSTKSVKIIGGLGFLTSCLLNKYIYGMIQKEIKLCNPSTHLRITELHGLGGTSRGRSLTSWPRQYHLG